MAAPGGAAFLAARGGYSDLDEFRARLRPPAAPALPSESMPALPVCTFQQIYIDYHWSVLHKIRALQALERGAPWAPAIRPFFLWIDTDRAGSDRLITAVEWPAGVGRTVAKEYM